jgi:eukaryotic-like serine/threonine-protein kinase
LALTPGTRLGVYEVIALLGEGGMGQVYRATDTKLKRQVAIKILPPSVAADHDRLARFQREAEVLASLNHPNIAGIYGLEESGGATLVMELVEGEELSAIIARGPIPVAEALPMAKQIAEALETAHELGIIHRDLKPANIKLRPDGTIKVLDFGLAKALEAVGAAPNVTQSPTITTPAMTAAGMILGTAAYMSPEQARGRTVDRRADIWAFGAVLFEMLTSTRAFPGDSITDTLAAVVRAEPEWSLVPGNVSPALLVFLRRSLHKDPKQRVGDIRDVRLALEGAFDVGGPQTLPPTPAAPRRPLWRRAALLVTAAVAAAAVAGGGAWTLRSPTPASPVMRLPLTLGEVQQFGHVNNQNLAVSPDGTHLVYGANNQLYLKSMSNFEVRPIPGTRETLTPYAPVFSPDSQSIAFYSPVDKAIKKIAVSGGAAVTICPAESGNTGAIGRMNWDDSGIVFSQPKGIMRVSDKTGQPEVLVSAKAGEVQYGPQLLPGGEWLLFTLVTGAPPAATAETWDKAQIVVQSLKSSERKTLVAPGSDGRYLPTGHLVYALAGVLFAVPFDLPSLAVTPGAVSVVEGVLRSLANTNKSGVASSVFPAPDLSFSYQARCRPP